jgi:hypothetical protein
MHTIHDWLVSGMSVGMLRDIYGIEARRERREVHGRRRWVVVTTKRGWVYLRGERIA